MSIVSAHAIFTQDVIHQATGTSQDLDGIN